MCDQTEVSYLEDDVVWVKIGPIWWPGVVKDLDKDDNGKEILAGLKKKPIAVVKFFQENNYEFVKNLDCIYHYNCRRKDEFIKKGLDKFRGGAPHMKKFPADVTTAESLTNGDINIINDPKFLPEKKESYSEIFGSSKKKTKKDDGTPLRSRNSRASAGITPYRPITHQRFINKVLRGESDHRVKTLIQTSPSSEDNASKNPYVCHICKFETSRVNVIVAHHRLSHSSKNSINWIGSDSKVMRKKTVYKSRKSRTKKLFDTSKDEYSDDEIQDKRKSVKNKSPKDKGKSSEKKEKSSLSPSKRKIKDQSQDTIEDLKKPRYTDVLLADWNEDFEEDKKEVGDKNEKIIEKFESKLDAPSEDGENKSENASCSLDSTGNLGSSVSTKSRTGKMSCFDFEEEEEGFIGMNNANTYGRKIPRVIPIKDKPELGMEMDLEIDELIQKKIDSDPDPEINKDHVEKNEENKQDENVVDAQAEEIQENDEKVEKDVKPATSSARRRRSKASKEEEQKVNAQNSLALRRTRRPGAKKSYLNEVIEQIVDEKEKNEIATNEEPDEEKKSSENPLDNVRKETVKAEAGSSSRRKQDFKNQTFDDDREEMVYSDIVKNEQKSKTGEGSEKRKGKHQNLRKEVKDDFVVQVDSLLEETKPSQLPVVLELSGSGKPEAVEETKSNAYNFSFDYLPSEQVSGKKNFKSKTEVKSISKMFGDSIPTTDIGLDGDPQVSEAEVSVAVTAADLGHNKTFRVGNVKLSRGSNVPHKRGSIVLSTASRNNESPVKVIPVGRQGTTSKECIVLPSGKKIEGEDDDQSTEMERSDHVKNIKTIRVKPETIPSSLLSAGKLKGQTIIHQKSGKYVIVTQPPQTGRQRVTSGKVQTGSKVVILTSQHGEQKIITTSGLQQSKFKVDGNKMLTTSDCAGDKETILSATTSQAQSSQPIIKMVPDGKGGIMKQLTVSPKKVLFGGTKVLVSASGSTFSSGNNIQKIALSGTSGSAKSGDFRLIENYKGSGKTVLIQGGSNTAGGVVLKSSSVVPRAVTKVVQNQQAIPALKKKPKILMRATSNQGEYVVQSASGAMESPTYVVKQKGTDGKFSAQKLVRTEILNQAKLTPSGLGTKKFFVSGQGSTKKGESYLITTNEALPSKVIRMRQKIKEADTAKTPQKTVSKGPELYAVAQNNILFPSQGTSETETAQIVQIEDQSQQPVLQTQVIAMPGPIGADGNQTYVLVSVDENGVVQGVDNSVVAYDASGPQDQIFLNSTSTGNVVLLNSQATEEVAPVFSTSSQDILAEALANTNVLEGNINNEMDTVVPSILLPPSIPSSVVQETSITLQKPIMTPLEMPSSVAPDTSSLEPPPLPPTPTDEDVLMEESEMPVAGNLSQEPINVEKEREMCLDDSVKVFVQPQTFEEVTNNSTNNLLKGVQTLKENEIENNHRFNEEIQSPRENVTFENSSDESVVASYQSMPLLNDEPDTSDNVQVSDINADQQLDFQKSRLNANQPSRPIREQEPPSSTINESACDHDSFSGPEKFEKASGDKANENDNREIETKKKELEENQEEENGEEEDQQLKDVSATKETQSMPILTTDDSNQNAFDMDPLHLGVVSQKRFQEETEVSSTTDEYANKDVPQ